jgi:hypothetical protein
MNEKLKIELNKIINELPDESSCLDYKIMPYENDKIHELIKDLCAFLNSEEAFGKDKYIIIGISDKKDIYGLKSFPMQDDRFYQSAADYIFPRPSIETGTIKHKVMGVEYEFGYIFISKDNVDRIYEIGKNYYYTKDKNSYSLEQALPKIAFASTAWIRRGSCKRILDEHTRRKIYETDSSKKSFSLSNDIGYTNTYPPSNNKIIKTALLFGMWNENNSNDKRIIEKYASVNYENFIEQFRLLAKKEQDFIFKNGVWKINNRNNHFKFYALDFYKEDFEKFYTIITEILNEKHPKLDLTSDKRNMYNIYNKITKYSEEIRIGVAETCTIIESIKSEFKNCKIDASNCSVLIVRKILENSYWCTWASLDKLLPYLAEASPSEFLNQFEDYLSRDKENKLMLENEEGITTYNYSTPIYWSLELIAWNTDYFVQACMILSKMARYDEKAIEHIVNIILPWHPNTNAPISFRLILVENILKENILIGWKILKKLMPGKTSYAVPTYKPKYINVPNEEISITNGEYYNQINMYTDLMIKYCKNSDERLIDLIDLLDKVSKDNFDKICKYLKSSKIQRKSDKSKYKLWDKLERLIYWIKKHSDVKEEIRLEMIGKIESVADFLKPKNNLYIISRLFKKDTWELIEDYNDYESSEKNLHELQLKNISELYSENNLDSIIDLVNIVEDTYSLGMIFSKLNISLEDEMNIIFSNLDKNEKLINFAKGYIFNKYNLSEKNYDIDIIRELSEKSKINFLLTLPYNMVTFKHVEELLKEDYKKYWKRVDIRFIKDEDALNYSVVKLMEVNRYERVLWMYRLSLHNNSKLTYDNNIILTCLEKIKDSFNQFDICEAIEELQKNNADKARLFYLEWKFLPLLNHGDYRPITMEKEIATNVNRYAEILELAFKEHTKEKEDRNIDQNIAMNAYRLLHQWKYVPGTKNNGFIDGAKLKQWYEEMKKICTDMDRLEVGLSCFGHVLFYSPKDLKNFWIDRTVAEILNSDEIVRRGFENEAINSIGAVYLDENASAYMDKRDEYQQKAKDTELAGYYNFATTLREIAHDFEFHAEHMKDTYRDL